MAADAGGGKDDGLIPPPSNFDTCDGIPISEALARVLVRNNRIKQHTALWYSTRKRMITCSDIAAVLGMNPYSSRNQVFRKKTGQSKPFTGNAATRRGNELEAVALRRYVETTGNPVWPEDAGLLQHKDYPQIGGSPDGITLSGILLEIKCPLTREIIPGYIPGYYIPQVQVLMEIFDLEEAHFIQYRPATRFADEVLDITKVPRDREFFARALPKLLDFMQEVTDFYEKAQLPIGTPMIDFEKQDPAAVRRKRKRAAEGKATVCAFVDDPSVGPPVFIMETHDGDKPVRRSQHPVVPNGTEIKAQKKQRAMNGSQQAEEVQEQEEEESVFDVDAIKARMLRARA